MKKKVLVTVDRGETRVAILERAEAANGGGSTAKEGRGSGRRGPRSDWNVAELYIERRSRRSIVGNIYKGKVDNVLPGMEAAFVDIGDVKNGFLHVDEVVVAGASSPRRRRGSGAHISDMLKAGQEIVVQVIKDPLKTKGARLTMQLSIPGRYMVFVPQGEGVGASRRLSDRERERLRRIAAKLEPKQGGLIVRTAAHGASKEELERELGYLFRLREVLDERVAAAQAPAMVFQEADLPVRVMRDVFSKDFESAIVDDEKQHHRVVSFFQRTAPQIVDLVELYSGKQPLFERYDIEKVFESTLNRRVDLSSGGYLMVDYAEALTVIDVNTGSYTGRGRGRLEDTITKTNVEAAEEVVSQLRLRDIGGIIVIDFIDMERARNRDLVRRTLEKHLELDRTRTYVVDISPLGLVEMTRQNVTEGVREIMSKRCPTCDGEGVVLSEETIAIDVERKLRELAAESKSEAYLINVHPRVAAILIGGGGKPLQDLERETGKHFHFEGREAAPLDTFSVTAEASRAEIEKRALPFQEGEEVLLAIEEPHMYNADDAIAKIDGYVISISGGGPYVGEQKLVRIKEVKRTAAYAMVIDNGNRADDGSASAESGDEPVVEDAAEPAAQEGEDGDQLQSDAGPRRRRRGRRGGRGRSGPRSKAGTTEEGSE